MLFWISDMIIFLYQIKDIELSYNLKNIMTEKIFEIEYK